MNVSKVTEKDFHMGDSMRLFDLLATDRIDRVVLNAEHGPMGATEVTWWNSKIGLILEKHSSNGGESLIIHPASATTCPGHGRSECVSCCWPKGDGYTAVDMGTAAADGYREGKANPELQMAHVVRALEKVRGGPVLTSNQCYDLARALNGIQRDRVKS